MKSIIYLSCIFCAVVTTSSAAAITTDLTFLSIVNTPQTESLRKTVQGASGNYYVLVMLNAAEDIEIDSFTFGRVKRMGSWTRLLASRTSEATMFFY